MKVFKIMIFSILVILETSILFNLKVYANNRDIKVIENTGNLILTKYEDSSKIYYNYKDDNNLLIYSWIFDKQEINKYLKINLDISFNSNILSKYDKNGISLDFKNKNILPKNTKIKIYLDNKYKKNDNIYLYSYDSDLDILRYENMYTVDNEEYITLDIRKCYEYVLTDKKIKNVYSDPQNFSVTVIVIVGMIIFFVASKLFTENSK